MNQKQIHIVCFQFLQGFLNRSLCFFISCIADPDLCGNEKFLSWQVAFYNCLTYAFFITICLSSVNAAVSVFNCSKYAALCFFRRSLINSIAKLRHFYTIISYKLDIENPIIRINTAFKGCSSLEKISVLPRIYHN